MCLLLRRQGQQRVPTTFGRESLAPPCSLSLSRGGRRHARTCRCSLARPRRNGRRQRPHLTISHGWPLPSFSVLGRGRWCISFSSTAICCLHTLHTYDRGLPQCRNAPPHTPATPRGHRTALTPSCHRRCRPCREVRRPAQHVRVRGHCTGGADGGLSSGVPAVLPSRMSR